MDDGIHEALSDKFWEDWDDLLNKEEHMKYEMLDPKDKISLLNNLIHLLTVVKDYEHENISVEEVTKKIKAVLKSLE